MRRGENLKPWQFQKGKSGNPGGGPKLPDELKKIRALSVPEVCRLVAKYARMTKAEMQAAITSDHIPMVELSIASIFAQCAKNGDYTRLAFLLDRTIGKPKDSGEIDELEQEISSMSTEELLQIVREKMPELDKPA